MASQFNPEMYLKEGITVDMVLEMKNAFDLFDVQQTGSVSAKELQAAMESFGFNQRNPAIYLMLSEIDSDGNGNINFDQWFSLMTPKAPIHDLRAHYSKVFALYDDERTGFISSSNIKRVAQDLGMTLTDKEILELVIRADEDGDGLVSEQEFFQILTYRK